jgi:hypothetical protein
MAAAKLVRARVSFACKLGGVEYLVHAGDVLPADHPAVKHAKDLFSAEVPVEQATAAPGEKRRR